MRTAVVILNWNTKGFLRSFLPPLLRSLGEEAEVIVADSASTDGSMDMMSEEFPSVRTIPLDANYGFTGGYNRALAKVEADYYVLINSDILVDDHWLDPLVAWMETHPECGICGPKLHALVKDAKGRYVKTTRFEYAGAAGGYLDRFGFPFCRGRVMKRVCEDEGQYDTPAEALWCTGACLMVRSSVWKALGGLDDRFFAHMEEIDLCWRARLAGWKVTVVPQSTVWHLGGGTLAPDSPWKLELNYRNNLLLLENNLASSLQAAGIPGEKAARNAARKISFRRFIDNCTRFAYACTGKREYAAAVKKAHEGWKELRRLKAPAATPAPGYPGTDSPAVAPAGLARVNMVPNALLRGKGIFKYLDNKLFKQ